MFRPSGYVLWFKKVLQGAVTYTYIQGHVPGLSLFLYSETLQIDSCLKGHNISGLLTSCAEAKSFFGVNCVL